VDGELRAEGRGGRAANAVGRLVRGGGRECGRGVGRRDGDVRDDGRDVAGLGEGEGSPG
jgi:hypothetical protein